MKTNKKKLLFCIFTIFILFFSIQNVIADTGSKSGDPGPCTAICGYPSSGGFCQVAYGFCNDGNCGTNGECTGYDYNGNPTSYASFPCQCN